MLIEILELLIQLIILLIDTRFIGERRARSGHLHKYYIIQILHIIFKTPHSTFNLQFQFSFIRYRTIYELVVNFIKIVKQR